VDFHAGPSSLGAPPPNTTVPTVIYINVAQFIELGRNVTEWLVPGGSSNRKLSCTFPANSLKKHAGDIIDDLKNSLPGSGSQGQGPILGVPLLSGGNTQIYPASG
jgi:hypothetical protein